MIVGDNDILRRLTRAVASRRAAMKALNKERRAAAARVLVERAAVHLAALSPELLDQGRLMLADLWRSQWRTPWTEEDRWAVVLEVLALLDEGVRPSVLARNLIQLGACEGTGKVAEVQACMTWMRKERHRYRHWRDRIYGHGDGNQSPAFSSPPRAPLP